MPTTAYVTHIDFRLHTWPNHPESANRLERIWAVLDETGMAGQLSALDFPPATVEQVGRVHAPALIERIEATSNGTGMMLDPDTYVVPASYRAALLAAGGTIAAVDAVLDGRADNALAVVRPPGHHATYNRPMGFCLFNNIAIATRHARERSDGPERVLIADYDVHHCNGTQSTFYEDPSVMVVSTHQSPLFPGTGHLHEIGDGVGLGTTINMPLPAGTGNDGFALLYERVLWPAARRFQPDLILVSAGFDAHWADPLAMLQLDLTGFDHLTRELIAMANELCGGRIAFVTEGGYDLDALAYGVLNIAHALQGSDEMIDPLGSFDMPDIPADALADRLVELHQLA